MLDQIFHVGGANLATFDSIAVKNLIKFVLFGRKCILMILLNCAPIFVSTLSLCAGINNKYCSYSFFHFFAN